MRRRLTWLVPLLLFSVAPARGGQSPTIEPGERGRVEGFVFDRLTRAPLEGARVAVEESGAFADSGRTVGLTDRRGHFRLETILGTRQSKFDLEQALLTFPLGFLIPGGVNRVTKVLYVMQVDLRVEKPGYKTLLSPVAAQHAEANRFTVWLHDVLLAPEASPLRSAAPVASAELRANSFKMSPAILTRGRLVKIETDLVVPRHLNRIVAWCQSLDEPAEWMLAVLKPSGRFDERTRVQKYVGELDLPRRSRERVAVFHLLAAVDDAQFGRRVPGAAPALLQVAPHSDDESVAQLIARGFAREQESEPAAALARYDEAAILSDFARLAHRDDRDAWFARAWLESRRGALLLRLNRPQEAVDLFARLADEDREHQERFLADYGTALLECGRAEQALKLLAPLARDRKKSRALPPDYFMALARCQLAQGDLPGANDSFLRAALDQLWSTEFIQEFNLERVHAMLKAEPLNPDAQLAHGRALAEVGRHDEALRVYQQLLQQDERQPWVYLDVAQSLTQLRRPDAARAVLVRALELQPRSLEARDALVDIHLRLGQYAQAFEQCKELAESPARARDFATRHRWALLQLWKGDIPAAMRELEHALYLSRGRSEVRNAGVPSPYGMVPFGSKRSLTTGFNREEAFHDFAILNELRDLAKNPQARCSQLNIGIALVELGFAQPGLQRLEQAMSAGLDLPELRYAMAVARAQLGESAAARQQLERLIADEPTLGKAYRKLAELHANDCETDRAQMWLLRLATVEQNGSR